MSDVSLLPDAAAGAGLLLAAVYGVSGVAKLREPDSTVSAFHQLRLPAWLHTLKAPALLGPAEIALAVALLVLPAPWYWVPAVAALLLGIVYTVLIVRALGFDVPVTCGCFGKLGQGDVTRTTVVRNLVLVALSAVTVLDAARGGSVVQRLASGPDLWWWLLVLVAAIALTWLISGGARSASAGVAAGSSAPAGASASASGGWAAPGAPAPAAAVAQDQAQMDQPTQEDQQLDDEELDYLRQPIPFMALQGDDGPVHLRELARQKAWLVLYVSIGCGSCRDALDRGEEFAEEFEHVGVLVVTTTPTATDHPDRPAGATVAYDENQQLRTMFELRSTPSALLVGADGLMAGGPVDGGPATLEFIEDVAEQLREAATA